MQVSLTATGGLERRLEVAIPAAQVDGEVSQRLNKISRTARLKGFRPGKAPLAVIRQQYGEQVHGEVINDLMRASFSEAVAREKLNPATGPRIEPIAMGPGADLKYAAGDRAVVDFVGKIDGEEFEGGSGQEVPIEIGAARVMKEFEDALLGASA